MLAIPYRLLQNDFVDVIFQDGKSFILKKTLNEPTINKHSYIAKNVFSMVMSGEQILKSDNGQQVKIKTGEIGLMPRGVYSVTDLLPKSGAFQAYLFFIDESIITEFLGQYKPQSFTKAETHFLKFPISSQIELFLESIIQLQSNSFSTPSTLFKIKMLELLYLLQLQQHQTDLQTFFTQLNIKKSGNLKQFLEQHYDKPLKVEDYAQLTGRSLSSFRRDFKRYFNTTPQKWLIDRRMRKAYQLLTEQNETVTNTAFEVGYDNISHFITAFKAKYEMTPKQLLIKMK